MRRNHWTSGMVVLLAGVTALTAAGCGSAAEGTGAVSGPERTSGSGGITIEHARGSTTLDGPVTRVVALEWTHAEDLLALGERPVGVADKQGYNEWVTAGPELGTRVDNVGTRQAPSLERITALKPDLIVTTKLRSESNYEQLAAIAPTLVFAPYETGQGQYAYMRSVLKKLGTAVGKKQQARQVLADLDAKIGQARRRLAEAGKAGTDVVVARGYTANDAPVIEILTRRTTPGVLIDKIGLRNAWTRKATGYGMAKVSVEDLKAVGDAHFMYVAEKEDDVFATTLSENALWRNLDFVAESRVHELDPGTWFFGGPLSAQQIVDEYVKALVG